MYINNIRSIGIILLLIATFILTVIIRNLTLRIEKSNEGVKRFEYGRLMTAIVNVFYETQKVSRQTYMLEYNIVKNSEDADYKNTLIRNILDKFKGLILEYATLFGGYSDSNVEEIKTHAIRKYESIISNNSISFNEKYKELNNLITFYANEFSKNFSIKQENIKSKKDLIKNIEKQKRFWNIIYILFQIIGLILISAAELINNFYLILLNFL
jgi:hypothetical protein